MKVLEPGSAEAENPRDCGLTVRCHVNGACKHDTLRTQLTQQRLLGSDSVDRVKHGQDRAFDTVGADADAAIQAALVFNF